MTLEQQWIEYDFNPFILFTHDGKIKSLNAEAQFLLGSATTKDLFNLATTHAPQTYGFNTVFIDFKFGRHKFFGLTVGFIDDEEIGIKLYRFPTLNQKNIKKPQGELTNIYTILDLCISTNSITNEIEFIKEYDPTLPEIIVNSSKLIQTLNKIYQCFLENKIIKTKVFYRIGEHIKYDNKKYSLFAIEISADTINEKAYNELEEFIVTTCFYIQRDHQTITINLPIIT